MKFYVLQREFLTGIIFIESLNAKNNEKAWQIIEEEITTNNSQEWLLTEKEFYDLKELIKNTK